MLRALSQKGAARLGEPTLPQGVPAWRSIFQGSCKKGVSLLSWAPMPGTKGSLLTFKKITQGALSLFYMRPNGALWGGGAPKGILLTRGWGRLKCI